jgi:ubiquinone/menaquinone biosynthesis C-methylase UbiE
MADAQAQIDQRNANFWDELCGSQLAQQLGIEDASPESLVKFDANYMGIYPYLEQYLPGAEARGKPLLEIGLGYGTVSQILAEAGADYHGLDIAPGPVEMVRDRISRLGFDDPESRVVQGSALDIPHPDASFDHLVAIGCLHHTGDLAGAINEAHRVLRPGGRAMIMVYNRRSYRRFVRAAGELPDRLRGRGTDEEAMRGAYDRNLEGEAAPATEYVSVGEAKQLCSRFASVKVRKENSDGLTIRGKHLVGREGMLGWPAHRAGLDLYITATK